MTSTSFNAPRRSGMTRKQRRLVLIGAALGVLALACGLVLYALSGSITLFNSPTDVIQKNIAPGTRMRLGGLVETGTLQRGDNMNVRFSVTDGANAIVVTYRGVLPDLFREGQGVVTEGVLQPGGSFVADNVLARHDETYMPKEVADALRRQGHWKPGDPPPAGGAAPQAPAQGSRP
jgi:cytochrome c-type biogenesis protein CcmE